MTSPAMLEWQYRQILAQLEQVALHASDPDCPCSLSAIGEFCLAKHTLLIHSLAAETAPMDPPQQKLLLELSDEALEKHKALKAFACNPQKHGYGDLVKWARTWRKPPPDGKGLEAIYYACSPSAHRKPSRHPDVARLKDSGDGLVEQVTTGRCFTALSPRERRQVKDAATSYSQGGKLTPQRCQQLIEAVVCTAERSERPEAERLNRLAQQFSETQCRASVVAPPKREVKPLPPVVPRPLAKPLKPAPEVRPAPPTRIMPVTPVAPHLLTIGQCDEICRAKGIGVVAGVSHTFALGQNQLTRYEFEYRLAEAESLIASHNSFTFEPNPAYPPELQPRLRARAAPRVQVEKIATNIDPAALLTEFHALDRGAPIVGPDMKVVESGNGRVMGIQLAIVEFPSSWGRYQAALKERVVQFGLTTAQVETMKHPVLVRVRKTEVDRRAFVEECNASPVLAASAIETARADALKITPAMLGYLQVGDDEAVEDALRSVRNAEFVRLFLGKLSPQEQGAVADAKGQLNQDGIRRITMALFLAAFPGDVGLKLAEKFFESTDPTVRNIFNGLVKSLGLLVRADGLAHSGQRSAELTIGPDIALTVAIFADIKKTPGLTVAHYLAQIPMLEKQLNDFQDKMLVEIDKRGRSGKRIAEMFRGYAQIVIDSPPPGQTAMLPKAQMTKEDVFAAALRKAEAVMAEDVARLFSPRRITKQEWGRILKYQLPLPETEEPKEVVAAPPCPPICPVPTQLPTPAPRVKTRYALFPFQAEGVAWLKDRSYALTSSGNIKAKDIDILTAQGWRPISTVTGKTVPEHKWQVSKALSEGKPVPAEVVTPSVRRINFAQFLEENKIPDPGLDHGMLGPSGRISARAEAAAKKRLRAEFERYAEAQREYQRQINAGSIIDPLGRFTPIAKKSPSMIEAEHLEQRAQELRNLAQRGMKPKAYSQKAAGLEAQAMALRGEAKPSPPAPKVAVSRRPVRKLLGAHQISDLGPTDKVVRRGDKTFVIDTQGQRAPVEVQSDKLLPEYVENFKKLTPEQQQRMIAEVKITPFLSEEGRAERLEAFQAKPTPAAAPKPAEAAPSFTSQTRLNITGMQGTRVALAESGITFPTHAPTIAEIVAKLDEVDARLAVVPKRFYRKTEGLRASRETLVRAAYNQSGLSEKQLRAIVQQPGAESAAVKGAIEPTVPVGRARAPQVAPAAEAVRAAPGTITIPGQPYPVKEPSITEKWLNNPLVKSWLEQGWDVVVAPDKSRIAQLQREGYEASSALVGVWIRKTAEAVPAAAPPTSFCWLAAKLAPCNLTEKEVNTALAWKPLRNIIAWAVGLGKPVKLCAVGMVTGTYQLGIDGLDMQEQAEATMKAKTVPNMRRVYTPGREAVYEVRVPVEEETRELTWKPQEVIETRRERAGQPALFEPKPRWCHGVEATAKELDKLIRRVANLKTQIGGVGQKLKAPVQICKGQTELFEKSGGIEHGFPLCLQEGKIVAGPEVSGGPANITVPLRCPGKTKAIGICHEHPSGNLSLSEGDKKAAQAHNLQVMCVTAKGRARCYRMTGKP